MLVKCKILFITFLCALETPWGNCSAAFPKKVRQCHVLVRTLKQGLVSEEISGVCSKLVKQFFQYDTQNSYVGCIWLTTLKILGQNVFAFISVRKRNPLGCSAFIVRFHWLQLYFEKLPWLTLCDFIGSNLESHGARVTARTTNSSEAFAL